MAWHSETVLFSEFATPLRGRLRWRVDGLMALMVVAVILGLMAGGSVARFDEGLANGAEQCHIHWVGELASLAWYLGDGTWLSRISLALGLAVVIKARSIKPALLVLSAWLVPSLLVGGLKAAMDRGAPRSGVVGFGEFAGGVSFPSGHASNCVVWCGVIGLLLAQLGLTRLGRVAWLAVPVLFVVLLAAMVYLRFHWFTDGVVGGLVGGLLVRQLARLFGPFPALRVPVDIQQKMRNASVMRRFGGAYQQ